VLVARWGSYHKTRPILKRGKGENGGGETRKKVQSDTKITHIDEELC
jgi:hypothetical protein